MKRFLSFILVAFSFLIVRADYSAIKFTYVGGDTHVISASGLEISFTPELLTASNSTTSITIPLTDVGTMEFSNETLTGIESVATDNACSADIMVYNLDGSEAGVYKSVDEGLNELQPGVYLFKYSDGLTLKIVKR